MTRSPLNLLTALSVLLCVATAALWVWSYHGCIALLVPRGVGDRLCITSEFGVVVVEVEGPLTGTPLPGWEYFTSPLPRRWPVRHGATGGFDVYRGSVRHYVRLPPTPVYGVAVPHWFLLIVTGALPAWRYDRFRRRAAARARAGHCPHCGYDLRATPDQCPECGAVAGAFDYAGARGRV
jgi:hypothetical protein